MDVPPNRFQLPEAFGATGDPCPGNPFEADDPRHDVWSQATRAAEEEVCRIRAASFSSLSVENVFEWHANLIVAKFRAWARRGVQVVWSDAALKGFDRWLLAYANAWLDSLAEHLKSDPPPIPTARIMTTVRNALAREVQEWKAEARRYRAAQDAIDPNGQAGPQNVTLAVLKRRRHLIRRYREKHELSADQFARRVGMSETAILGVVKGDRKRFAPEKEQRLLDVLGVTLDDWDRER